MDILRDMLSLWVSPQEAKTFFSFSLAGRVKITFLLLGKGSKTPGTETFRWGGTPPRPRGLHGRDFSEKLAEKS